MSDEKVLADLRALRNRLTELEEKQAEERKAMGLPMLAVAVAAVTFALTMATWYTLDTEDGVVVSTLWSLGSNGWFPMLALPLVLLVCLATLRGFSIDPAGRVRHFVWLGLSIVTAGWVLFIGAGVPEDAESAPARWLTVLGLLIIAGMHGKRAGELRDR